MQIYLPSYLFLIILGSGGYNFHSSFQLVAQSYFKTAKISSFIKSVLNREMLAIKAVRLKKHFLAVISSVLLQVMEY